jgi:hypothetical protein
MINVSLPIIEILELACKRLHIRWDITEEDIKHLKELDEALGPIEDAINMLGGNDVNLLRADTLYRMAYDELDTMTSDIARILKNTFFERVNSRRNATLLHLMGFLNNPRFLQDNQRDWFGHDIIKEDDYALANKEINQMFPDEMAEIQPEASMDLDEEFFEDLEDPDEVKNVSLNERIKLAWKKDEQQTTIKSTKKGPNFIENLCDSYAQCSVAFNLTYLCY